MTDSCGNFATVFKLSRPLVGGIAAPEEADEISLQVMFKFVAILRSFPEAESTFVKLDEYLKEVNFVGNQSRDGFSRITPSFSASLRSRWEKASDRLSRVAALTVALGADQETAKQLIGQIVESYMLHNVAHTMGPWLSSLHAKQNNLLDQVLRVVKPCSQADLGVAPELEAPQHEAIKELKLLSGAKTPVDKMLLMKSTVKMIRESVDRNVQKNFPGADVDMATDDLVLVLIWIIAQAYPDYTGLFDDVIYVSEFHFVSSSRSQLGFNLCHFQVALTWFTDRAKCFENETLSEVGLMGATATPESDQEAKRAVVRKLDLDFIGHGHSTPTGRINMQPAGKGPNHAICEEKLPTSAVQTAAILNHHFMFEFKELAHPMCGGESMKETISKEGSYLSSPSSLKTDTTSLLEPTMSSSPSACGKRPKSISASMSVNDDTYEASVGVQNTHHSNFSSMSTRSPVMDSPCNDWSSLKLKDIENLEAGMEVIILNLGASAQRGKPSKPITILSERTNRPGKILRIAGYDDYYAAVNCDLHVFTWGMGSSGRLGHGVEAELDSFAPVRRPQEVVGLGSEMRISDIACGE